MSAQRRRLSAILAADVVGYSRLVGLDEAGTVARVRALFREVAQPEVARAQGRVFKVVGDGFLAEFPSAVGAVACAAAIQAATEARAAAEQPDRRIRARIGVHLGDVLVEGSDLFGDGVNIAARLEGLADPGGVALSAPVADAVRGRIPQALEDLGERELRNIDRPIRVFRLATAVPEEPPRLAVPKRPSLVVLPFQNLSGDPEQDYFADGIVEDVTTALACIRSLFVIARNSAFTYKGRAVDVRQVGRELGVRYVLEGSVRKAGARVRITGQLIEAESGHHIWADRFDGDLADVFDLQDRVTESVVGAVAPRLEAAEVSRARRKRPEMLDAWDLVLRALPLIHGMSRAGIEEALALLARAYTADPGYGTALGLAAWCHTLRIAQLWSATPDDADGGLDLARRAIDAGGDDPDALSTGGYALGFLGRDPAAALPALDRALALAPSAARSFGFSGWMRFFAGDHTTALDHFARALRLSPLDPLAYRTRAGEAFAYLFLGQFDMAAEAGRIALRQQPNFTPAHRALIAALGHLGRRDEARLVVRDALTAAPGLCVSSALAVARVVRPEDRALLKEGLRLGGLPE